MLNKIDGVFCRRPTMIDTLRAGKLGLATVLVLAVAVCYCSLGVLADSEPSSPVQSGGDSVQPNEQFAPKRQYFIAPRIGRSMHQSAVGQSQQHHGTQSIWSSLEEGSRMAPGQMQPSHGYPGPLRASLLYLIGNRRLIGPRSPAGLLPQARIGRRAAPSGLLPQPRVGRRSLDSNSVLFEPHQAYDSDALDTNEMAQLEGTGGQQEVAISAMSDNAAINDAVESLING